MDLLGAEGVGQIPEREPQGVPRQGKERQGVVHLVT